MGYMCCLCNKETNCVTVKEFLQHFYSRHRLAKYDKIKLCCGQDSCMRTLDNLKSLGQHIRRSHPVCSDNGDTGNGLVVINQCVTEQDESHNASDSDSLGIDKSDLQNYLKQDIAHAVLRAQMKMGQSNLVSDGIKEVLLTSKRSLCAKIECCTG